MASKKKTEVEKAVEQGDSTGEIAFRIGRSRRQTRRIIRDIGKPRPPHRPKKTLVDSKVKELYDKVNRLRTLTMGQAAEEAGMSISTLRRRFKEYLDAQLRAKLTAGSRPPRGFGLRSQRASKSKQRLFPR
jgi:AraC-like DNA-binding protein